MGLETGFRTISRTVERAFKNEDARERLFSTNPLLHKNVGKQNLKEPKNMSKTSWKSS